MYDIAIIGSGPAGAALARLIGRRYKVLLIDKRDLENPDSLNGKCCGGLLAPDAQNMIARLGLGMPKEILVGPQLFAVRTIDLTNNLEGFYQRFYLNMDRDKFDSWLVSLIPPEVDKMFNAFFKDITAAPYGYEIKYICNGQEISAKARAVIGADGASSRVRKLIGKNVNIAEKYIAIQEWFECPDQMPYFTAIFDKEISDFYSWIIPKKDFMLFGAALSPKNGAREKYDRLKEKLTSQGFSFGNKIKTEGAYICRPKKLSGVYAGKDNIALIGEAACAISPSSAEGISYALKTALYLAQSLEVGIDGFLDRYSHKLSKIKLNLLLKNLKSPAMYNPALRRLAIKSGLRRIK